MTDEDRTHYYVVAIKSSTPRPQDLSRILCRELYLQFGGERAKVWDVDHDVHAHDLQQMLGGVAPIDYDPVIDDGNPPPGYEPVHRGDGSLLGYVRLDDGSRPNQEHKKWRDPWDS